MSDGSHNRSDINAYIGESECGKSTAIKLRLLNDKPRRLMIWDRKDECSRFGKRFAGLSELGKLAREVTSKDRFAVTFVPNCGRDKAREAFDVFCQLAYEKEDVCLVNHELSDVTEPGWAPEGWEMCTSHGRHNGLVVIGASQMPSNIDKTFLSNCSRVYAFRVTEMNANDRMARMLSLDRAQMAEARRELATLANHEYIEFVKNPRAIQKKITSEKDRRRVFNR